MNRREFLHLFPLPLFAPSALAHGDTTLYAQSLQSELSRAYPHLELLIVQTRERLTLVDTFSDSSSPLPVGSLLKPFLAHAYLSRPNPASIDSFCHGHSDLCWKLGGHGRLSLPQALAQSCNAYFLALARTLSPDLLQLPNTPPIHAQPEDLIGLTPRWQIAPNSLVQAYAQLLATPAGPIAEGMALAASIGTASRIGAHPGGVLAKTGTAPCVAACKASGDGLTFAAVPAVRPRLLLLVRRRGTTDADAAAWAGTVLNHLGALRAL